jgi:hypothetical protein
MAAKGSKINGVDLGLVDTKHLCGVLDAIGVDYPEGPMPDAAVLVATREFSECYEDSELGICDNCGGKSPYKIDGKETDACAFCGVGDEESEPDQADSDSEAGSASGEPDSSDSDEDGCPNDEASGKDNPIANGENPRQEEGKGKVPKKEEEGRTEPMRTRSEPAKAIVKAATTDLKPASQIATEAVLDEKVEEVRQLKSSTAVSYWKLGRVIGQIYRQDYWKLRRGEAKDGAEPAPRWKSFDAFCLHELQMSPVNAHKMVDVSESYTEEQVRAFGTSKLGLILQAPEPERPALLEQARQGASKRELEAEVRKAKRETGYVRPTREGGAAGGRATGATGAGRKPREEKVTVASIVGACTVKLYTKPPKRDYDPKDLERAKSLKDLPWGEERMENGVTVYYQLVENAKGEWQLKVERVRDKE